ncbi:MAG: translational GTPase TypA [Bordetella sp.]|nr:MAG: translational GTPase TypA [Bordetella sp.]
MINRNKRIINVAIIAHIDHGKTTMIDQLLRQSGIFRENQILSERIMDSNDLEKERGITILSKNCSIEYNEVRINILDTPGHADFGGEVERVLSMVDSVLLLIDSVEGPMPQTIFVTKKALALGLKPIVVINKIDRPGSRPDDVVNKTFDLFSKLEANDEQLDFPIVYASGLSGFSSLHAHERTGNMKPLLDTLLNHVQEINYDYNGPFQMQISSVSYDSYIGRTGMGRINRGYIYSGMPVAICFSENSDITKGKIGQIIRFDGLERISINEAKAGDIILISGIENLNIGTTITDPNVPDPLPPIYIDEPTLTMNFMVNTSPLAGSEGKFVTARQIRDRLNRETKFNVALQVKELGDGIFEVSGRGELHLTILLETMRREGYELAVSQPNVVCKTIKGEKYEPFETLILDIQNIHQGSVMEELSYRKADLQNITQIGSDRTQLEYIISGRGLIGLQNELMTLTRGTGLINHAFCKYDLFCEKFSGKHRNGALISQNSGKSVAYALWKLQERGHLFIKPGENLYEGMIIGIHNRDNDLVVNPIKGKQLTNIRASGNDDAIRLFPPIELSLEYAVEFIASDELVEVTPKSIRLRKLHLQESKRRQTARKS